MQVSEAVLTELSIADVSDDGRKIALGRKVEHRLYQAVDKVLRALGGDWNCKASGHLFEEDVRGRLELVLTTGNVATDADLGFFETPEDLARTLVSMAEVRRGDFCLEPSAGKGRIVFELLDAGASVVAVERSEERRVFMQTRFAAALASRGRHLVNSFLHVDVADDFMVYRCEEPFDRVVMNPPFLRCGLGDHLDHVRRAYGMLIAGGVLVSVLPTGITFRQDRRHKDFKAWAEARGEIVPLPEGTFKPSGTGVNTCIVRLSGGVA